MYFRTIAYLLGTILITNGCASFSVASCTQTSTEICGFHAPEDIAVIAQGVDGEPVIAGIDPSRPFLLVVDGMRGAPSSWFSLIDTSNAVRFALSWRIPLPDAKLGAAECAPPSVRKPRGFDVRRMPDGRWLLAVITDDQSQQRIEYVDLARDAGGWSAQWLGCVSVPPDYFLNDVALGPRGEVFATHMYNRSADSPEWRRIKLFFGVATGSAVMWPAENQNGDKGWRAIPNTEGSFPNGIAVDPTGSVLFVAYTYNSRLTRIDLLSGERKDVDLPLRPDNLSWAKDSVTKADMLIVAGGNGLRMISTWNCEAQKPACIFPFAVAAINSTSLSVQTLYATDRQAIPGASVAVKLGQTLYLGTAFGDRVTVVPLSD
jgi:hypothetical protein